MDKKEIITWRERVKKNPLPDGKVEREKLYHKYGELLPEALGRQVLMKTYIAPEKIGAIYIPNQVQEASIYHNMCGLVLDVGPDAFKEKDNKTPWDWGDKLPKLGDWVIMPRMEYVFLTFIGWQDEDENISEKIELRFTYDYRILGFAKDPSYFTGAHILGR
jgi:hypothetical protein